MTQCMHLFGVQLNLLTVHQLGAKSSSVSINISTSFDTL